MEILDSDMHNWELIQSETGDTDPREYLAGLMRKKWAFILVMALFIGMGVLFIKLRKPVYEATAQIVVVNSSESGASAPDNDIPLMSDLQALTRSRSLNTQVEVISSPEVIEEAYRTLGSETQRRGFGEKKVPNWAYNIEGVKETDVIRISAKAYTPEAAAEFANGIAGTYFERDIRNSSDTTRKAREYAESNMKVAEKNLSQANSELTDFKEQTGFIAPTAQLNRAVERLTDLATALDQTKAQTQADQQEVASLQNQLTRQGKTVETSRNIMRNPRIVNIVARIDALNSERISLLQEFTPESPEVTRVNGMIKQEQALLSSVTKTVVDSKIVARNPVRDTILTSYATSVASLAGSIARERAIQSELDEWQSSLQQMPNQERQYLDLAQRVAMAQRTYDALATKYRTLLLSEQTVLPRGTLFSKASPPDTPRYPSKKNVLLVFTILGAMIGVAAAIGLDHRDQRIHNLASIERMMRMEALALLPETPKRTSHLLNEGENNNETILEAYRILRNSITLSCEDSIPRMIAITSPGNADGKSTVSINLATAMAMDGMRTLLVDTNVRKPSIHKLLSLPNEIGLTTLLRGELDIDDTVLATKIDNVYCLPAGQIAQDFPELLNSSRGRELFNKMHTKYDIVILDCSPCVGSSEMQVLSTIVDGILAVVSMNTALAPRLRAAAGSLERSNAPTLGLAINRVQGKTLGYSYIAPHCGYTSKVDSNGSKRGRTRVN